MLRLVDLAKSYGSRPILDDVSLTISSGEKIALVGANGVGKTTLLRIVFGEEEADSGSVQLANGWIIGYLPQDAGIQDDLTLRDEMLAAHADLLALQHEAAEIEQALYGDLPEDDLGRLVDRHAEVLARFEARGGYRVEAEIHKILAGLGFGKDDLEKRTDHFSGGWRTRIALAKLLVRAPDLMLLDEPTNHLDLEATEWLEQYLKTSGASAIVVSHDRYFLDRMISRTVELERGKLIEFAGNYSYYLGEKERRFNAAQTAFERQQRELKRQQGFIDRFRAKATKATQVKSREKALAKIERVEAPRVESRGMAMRFPPARPSHREVVTLQDVVKRYGTQTVFDGLALMLERGERLALVGPNGSGKSTLLRMLADVEPPDRGTLLLGAGVTVGYYAQDQTEVLKVGRTVMEEAWAAAPAGARPPSGRCSAGSASPATMPTSRSASSPAARRPGLPSPACCFSRPTCCCWTSRPTTWTWPHARSWSAPCASSRVPSSWPATTATSWTASPPRSARSAAGGCRSTSARTPATATVGSRPAAPPRQPTARPSSLRPAMPDPPAGPPRRRSSRTASIGPSALPAPRPSAAADVARPPRSAS